MPRTLRKLPNGLSIKWQPKKKKYYLYYKDWMIKINGQYQKGWKFMDEIVTAGQKLTKVSDEDWRLS